MRQKWRIRAPNCVNLAFECNGTPGHWRRASCRMVNHPKNMTVVGVTSPFNCRVENRRSGCSLPVAVNGAFATSPQSGLTWLWFLFPLIEPDRRISRIRLSEKGHEVAHGKLAGRLVSRTSPNLSCRSSSGYRLVPAPFRLCLAPSHWRSRLRACCSTAR